MKNKSNIIAITIIIILISIIFGLIMAHELKLGDFPAHINWAREYSTNGYLNRVPHTLFAKSVIIVRTLLPANIIVKLSSFAKQVYDLKSFEIASWLVMLLSYLGTAIILMKRIIGKWGEENNNKINFFATIATLFILLVGPIYFLTYPEKMYLGYISPNPYHSPTYILLRPFALLIFYKIVDNLYKKWDWKQSLLIAIFIVFATLSKPNFTISMLPAGFLVIILFHFRELRKFNWFLIFFAIFLPSLLILIEEYLINYSSAGTHSGINQILIKPFYGIHFYEPNTLLVILFSILSILFPLLYSIFYFSKIKKEFSFQFLWINFLISMSYAFLLTERVGASSLNFWWGMMIGLFLLFAEAISFWGKEILERNIRRSFSWIDVLLGCTLLLHLICGIIYYLKVIQSTNSIVF